MAFGDFKQSPTPVNTTASSTTIGGAGWTSNVTAASIICVGVRSGGTGRGSLTVTADSAPINYTEGEEHTSGSDHQGWIYYGLNAVGSDKPTITVNIGSSATLRIVAAEFEGTTTAAKDTNASDAGTGTTASSGTTASRAAADELQIGVMSIDSTNSFTAGSGFSFNDANCVVPASPSTKIGIESIVRSSGGSEAADCSFDASQTWVAMTVTFYDNAGGADTIHLLMPTQTSAMGIGNRFFGNRTG